jgi:Cu(I)/Ag(I) efflux system membrane fusion protein
MRYFLLIPAAAGMLGAASCSSNNNPQTSAENTVPQETLKAAPASNLKADGTQNLTAVLNDYYALKDALVATNPAQADEAAYKLTHSVLALQAYLQTDSANQIALLPLTDSLRRHNQEITAVKDESCTIKRVHFEHVTTHLLALLKTAGLKNAGIYVQHCPMAFDDRGADWLSNVADIQNPYFGKKMLTCGEVTDSLQ